MKNNTTKKAKKVMKAFFKILVQYAISQIDWNSVWDFVTKYWPEISQVLS